MTPLALFLLLACVVQFDDTGTAVPDSDPPADPEPALEGDFVTENSAGRTGSYFVPEGWNLAPLPVLVGYHGTGGIGSQQVGLFRDLAEQHGFGIVAPDSRMSPSGQWTWEVGTDPGEITEDLLHTQALIEELESFGLVADFGSHLATGFSGGASSGPYMASNDSSFVAYASLHGGAFPGGMGDNQTVGWFSTGEDDTTRSPEHVQEQADAVEAAGYPTPEVHIYPGSHSVGPQEAAEMVDWWHDALP